MYSLYNGDLFVGFRYILPLRLQLSPILSYPIRTPSFLVPPSWVDWTRTLHQKGICFVALFILVVWLSSPSCRRFSWCVLFDTAPNTSLLSLLSHVGLSFRIPVGVFSFSCSLSHITILILNSIFPVRILVSLSYFFPPSPLRQHPRGKSTVC